MVLKRPIFLKHECARMLGYVVVVVVVAVVVVVLVLVVLVVFRGRG